MHDPTHFSLDPFTSYLDATVWGLRILDQAIMQSAYLCLMPAYRCLLYIVNTIKDRGANSRKGGRLLDDLEYD